MNCKHSAVALVVLTALVGCGSDNNELDGKDGNLYPPQTSNVAIPNLHVGQTVKGMYNYLDPNASPRPEGNSKYAWRDDADGLLGTTQEIYFDFDHHNRNIQFCVTPIAQGTVNTAGEEECSTFKKVGDPLGEPPVAENVTVDNMTPQVGETLEGSYDYSHPDSIEEGSSEIVWRADGQAISGADTTTLELEAAVTEGKAIDFCVTPRTNQNPSLIGEQVCSDATAPVAPIAGSAPEVANVAVNGDAFVHAYLTGTYDFTDIDGDLEGNSQFRWLRDGVDIIDAIEKNYRATAEDDGTFLSFCVTPVSATGTPTDGVESCVQMDEKISTKIEVPPTASDVKIEGSPEVGETVTGSYVYEQSEGAPEGQSTAHWKLGGVQQPECDSAQDCSFTVDVEDLGNTLEYCVMPRTVLTTPADDYTCSGAVDTKGIKLTGALEYDNTLTAIAYGYSENLNEKGRWMIDSSNQDGPGGDGVKTEQAKGNTYTIGVREGTATDFDWDKTKSVDARNFIGKSVEFCLDTDAGSEVCVNAADFDDVTGGLYTNVSDATVRSIEPVRTHMRGGATYHRPLTAAESQLKDNAGFGTEIPTAVQTATINGIEWALFAHDENGQKDILNVCRNLYAENGEWHLPIGYFTGDKYIYNMYESEGNNPPTVNGDSLNNVAKKDISSTYSSNDSETDEDMNVYASRVFGWPVSTNDNNADSPRIPYGTASVTTADNKVYEVRFYNFGSSSSANVDHTMGRFVSCVK